MSKQKFEKFDLVRVAESLPTSMGHFRGRGEAAIVVGSYADQYGGCGRHTYTLLFPTGGEVSWYDEELLTLIKANDRNSYTEFKESQRKPSTRNELDEAALKEFAFRVFGCIELERQVRKGEVK